MNHSEDHQVSLFSVPLVLFLVAVLLFVALLNSRAELALFTLMVLTLFGGTYLFSRLSFRRLSWRTGLDKPRLFPDERVLLTVEVANAKFLPVWVNVRVEANQGGAITADGALCGECGLLWHQQARFEWAATAVRRGVHKLGAGSLTAADLFGLYPHEKPLAMPQIIVYPRLIEVRPLALPKQEMFGLPGRRSPVQDPVYLLGTRDYRSGRPARFIHWKASARHHRLQEKLFDPSEQEKVLLALDVQSFARCEAEEALERAIEVVASVAVQLDNRASAFGFACNARMTAGADRVLSVAGHRHQISALLELLAHIEPAATLDLKTVLARGVSLPWGVSAMVFGYSPDPSLLEVDCLFTSRRIPVVLAVTDAGTGEGSEPKRFKGKLVCMDQLCGIDGSGI